MALDPLNVDLSNGEKLEALKRFRRIYNDELEQVEDEMRTLLTAKAEYEFLKQYIGEQPEVQQLLENQERLDKLEKRRQHVGMLVDRLDQVIPKDQGSETAANFQRY